jgi:hypothetical protein
MDPIPKRGFVRRVMAAMALDVSLYEEVEHDREALGQAIVVVVGASLSTAIGVTGFSRGASFLLTAFISDLIGWFLWAGITYLIGTRLVPARETSATWGQLLRATGFSAAPGLLGVLIAPAALVGFLSMIAFLVIVVWTLVAFVLAVRQALDYANTWRAVFVCVISWPIYLFARVLLTVVT